MRIEREGKMNRIDGAGFARLSLLERGVFTQVAFLPILDGKR
jgi:hypothetical protein